MSAPLKPCLFCGEEAEIFDSAAGPMARCSDNNCVIACVHMAPEVWNYHSRNLPPAPATDGEAVKAFKDTQPKIVKVNPRGCARCGRGPGTHAGENACAEYVPPILNGNQDRLAWALGEADSPGDVPYRIKMALQVLAAEVRRLQGSAPSSEEMKAAALLNGLIDEGEARQEWLESFADKIRAKLHKYGYEEQEGDEGEEDVVRSLVALAEKLSAPSPEESAALEAVVEAARACRFGHYDGKVCMYRTEHAELDKRVIALVDALDRLAKSRGKAG